jgi:hypothetical protein
MLSSPVTVCVIVEPQHQVETVVPKSIVCVFQLTVVDTVVSADDPLTTIAKVLLSPI